MNPPKQNLAGYDSRERKAIEHLDPPPPPLAKGGRWRAPCGLRHVCRKPRGSGSFAFPPVRGITPRHGFSRVDLVMLAAIGVLGMSLLLPAVQSARESARRYQCQSHLRQLGVALHSYHDRQGMFPPAATWGSEGLDLPTLDSHEDPTPIHVTRQNWIQLLLPDLDQAVLAGRFDPAVPAAHENNRAARTTPMPSLACPSDPYNRPDNFYRMPLPDGSHAEFARGNYAINGGSEFVPASFGTLANPDPTHSRYVFNEATREFRFSGNGIAGINESLSLRDFRNGLATLVAVEEVRAGLAQIDTRGAWALGQVGASITWGHGVIGDDGAPNATQKDAGADDIRQGPELYKLLGRAFIDGELMQACDHCDENDQATARSKHAGGVQVLTLDGAVHFVSDNVEPTLWHVMHSRETPAELLADRFAEELTGPIDLTAVIQQANSKTSRSAAAALPKEIENSIGMKFVRISAGEFSMGSRDAGFRLPFPPDAIPHRVRITRDYLLGIHEVTPARFHDHRVVGGDRHHWHSARAAIARRADGPRVEPAGAVP